MQIRKLFLETITKGGCHPLLPLAGTAVCFIYNVFSGISKRSIFCLFCKIDVKKEIIALGVIASRNGTLSFLVGGSKTGFERAKPILECMGQNIFHCGGVATGQVRMYFSSFIIGFCCVLFTRNP